MDLCQKAGEILISCAGAHKNRKVACGIQVQGGADNGLDPEFRGGVVGTRTSVEAHVIGNRDRLIAKVGSTRDEILRLAGTTEK